jgi:hypothetical protein
MPDCFIAVSVTVPRFLETPKKAQLLGLQSDFDWELPNKEAPNSVEYLIGSMFVLPFSLLETAVFGSLLHYAGFTWLSRHREAVQDNASCTGQTSCSVFVSGSFKVEL